MSTDLRQIITDRLADLGWSVGDLVRALDGRVTRTAVYEFVRGDRDIYSSGVEAILGVLGASSVAWSPDWATDAATPKHGPHR